MPDGENQSSWFGSSQRTALIPLFVVKFKVTRSISARTPARAAGAALGWIWRSGLRSASLRFVYLSPAEGGWRRHWGCESAGITSSIRTGGGRYCVDAVMAAADRAARTVPSNSSTVNGFSSVAAASCVRGVSHEWTRMFAGVFHDISPGDISWLAQGERELRREQFLMIYRLPLYHGWSGANTG